MKEKLEKVKTWAMAHKPIAGFIVVLAVLLLVSQCQSS